MPHCIHIPVIEAVQLYSKSQARKNQSTKGEQRPEYDSQHMEPQFDTVSIERYIDNAKKSTANRHSLQ